MPAKRREPKTITVRQGEDFEITYTRGQGYDLKFQGQYVGSFDRADDAQTARDDMAFDQLRRTN